MKFDPPLPDDYTAWIHRAGWILYVHEPTQQGSWMHPEKLVRLAAKGLKGPGKVGPEMWIWEQNVNRGGHYIVDYGYPPLGKVVSSMRPFPGDFRDIDEMGWDAWNTTQKVENERWHREHDKDAGKHNQDLTKFWAVKKKVMKEQCIGHDDNNHKADALLLAETTDTNGGVFEDSAEVSISEGLEK